MSSDILKDDFKSLEALRSAFPTFIRDYAMWKRCYSADHSSWNTAEFHSNCDSKGPSLTIIRVRQCVFGGFVEQSWGGMYYNKIRSLFFKQSMKIVFFFASTTWRPRSSKMLLFSLSDLTRAFEKNQTPASS